MTEFFPEGVSTLGNETLIFIPALADPEAPTVLELTGASAINLSMAVRGFNASADQGVVQDVRLGSTDRGEIPGAVTPSIDDVVYVYDPQDVGAASPDSIHYDTLKKGTVGYLVDRRGLSRETVAVAAAQIVDVYHVEFGAQRRQAIDPGSDGGQFEIIQKPFVKSVLEDVAIAA